MFSKLFNYLSNWSITTSVKPHLSHYPTPITINYFYGFGFISGIFLAIQIASGMLLTVFYIPNANFAFESVEFIMNEVPFGWLLRNIHQTGASFFFMAVYIHIGRSLYFKSFYWPNTYTWWIGLLIFLLMIATAFLGYVLPWSQMGFWAATVILNLFTAVPVIGPKLVIWLWGGYSVCDRTLKKFAILHYALSFLIVGLAGLHIVVLHKAGSSDLLLTSVLVEKLQFWPFFIKKDFSFFSLIFLCYMFVVGLEPTIFNEPDIYTKANHLVGVYVIPEWYFLPLFGFIKCVRSKIVGIFLILLLFLLLAACPLLANFSGLVVHINDQNLYTFILLNVYSSYVSLGLVAAQPLTQGIFFLCQVLAFWFFFFLILAFFVEAKNDIKEN